MTNSKDMGGPCNVGDLLPVISRQVTQDRVDLYAEAAKDFNPVHLDEELPALRSSAGESPRNADTCVRI